jgi:hypothetical protein
MMSFGLTTTDAFPIIVPNHITNISGETEAMVMVDVLGLDIAFRSITNLQAVNVPLGYRAEILTQSLDISLRGELDDLIAVTPMNVSVIADLAGWNAGTARVPARVYLTGIDTNIDAIGEYRITVTISPDIDIDD